VAFDTSDKAKRLCRACSSGFDEDEVFGWVGESYGLACDDVVESGGYDAPLAVVPPGQTPVPPVRAA
jgi:hypothetical protein